MRWLLLGLVLTLGACAGSPWGESEARRQAEEAKNIFPAGYKSDLLAFQLDPSKTVRELVGNSVSGPFEIYHRVYGIDGVFAWPEPPAVMPREVFVMVECIAPTSSRASEVVRTTKQYLLQLEARAA